MKDILERIKKYIDKLEDKIQLSEDGFDAEEIIYDIKIYIEKLEKEKVRCYIVVFYNGDTIKHCCTGKEMLKKIYENSSDIGIDCGWVYEVQNNDAIKYSFEDFLTIFNEEENE